MADLGWLEFQTASDFDGDVHHSDRAQWRKDLKRAPRFEDAGWSYVRDGAPDLHDPAELIATIIRRLQQNGWRGV